MVDANSIYCWLLFMKLEVPSNSFGLLKSYHYYRQVCFYKCVCSLQNHAQMVYRMFTDSVALDLLHHDVVDSYFNPDKNLPQSYHFHSNRFSLNFVWLCHTPQWATSLIFALYFSFCAVAKKKKKNCSLLNRRFVLQTIKNLTWITGLTTA